MALTVTSIFTLCYGCVDPIHALISNSEQDRLQQYIERTSSSFLLPPRV